MSASIPVDLFTMAAACHEAIAALRSQQPNAAGQVRVSDQPDTSAKIDGSSPVPAAPTASKMKAELESAAGQERQPSDQGRVNPVRSPQTGTTPAPAAPTLAEARALLDRVLKLRTDQRDFGDFVRDFSQLCADIDAARRKP